MTMSHLLKQTKKCCAKIIRKLSFNPGSTATNGGVGGGADQSPTNNGHGLNNRITAKYVLHKNCTPTRCKIQPRDDVAADGWTETRMSSDGGSPAAATPPIPETQNNYRPSRSLKNLPKKRTNISSNKNVNLRKCFRLRSKTFDGPLSEVDGGGGGRTAPADGLGSSPSIVEPTVERRETVAADSLTLASNNSSSRLIGAKLDKISKSLMRVGDADGAAEVSAGEFGGAGGLATKISKPLFLSTSKHRRSNYSHIEVDDEESTLRGAAPDDRRGGWRPDEELVLTSAPGAGSVGRREHGRLEQETTLSTMVEDDVFRQAPSVMERLTVAETATALLFEKVKYDRTKRYLIDQLTEAGGGGGGGGGGVGTPNSSPSCCSSPFHLAKSDDFVDPWKNYNIRGGTGWDKVSKSPWDSSAKPSPVRGDSQTPLTSSASQNPVVQQPVLPMRTHWNPFEYSPAHLARLTASSSTPQQQQQQQQQYRPAFQVQTDVWENLNCKQYEIDTDVVWRSTRCSSRRTSASTVETWIDDETFDNSFNEELERRCATLKICE